MTIKSIEKLSYDKTIGILNNNPLGRGFAHPIDIALHDEEIFILNKHPGFTRVGVCTYDEQYLREFGTYGHADGQFWLPTGVSVSADGQVAVCDEFHHNVSLFSNDGQFIKQWGEKGDGEGELDGPSGLVIDDNDDVYVVDQNNHRIQKFSINGNHIASWGEYGMDSGQLNQPWGLTIGPDQLIYVGNWGNDNIEVFDPEGNSIRTIGGPGEDQGSLRRPSKPAVDRDGFVYVTDWGNERVKVFSPGGDCVQSLRGEATLSQWAQDFLDANPDENNERVRSDLMPDLPDHFNTPYLISTQIESYFWGPSSLFVGGDSKLYVLESSRHRIQIYDIN